MEEQDVYSAGPSTTSYSAEENSETDVDENMLLVDETSSDNSDEIAVFDNRDLSFLDDDRKALCEDRMSYLYKIFRHNGPDYRTTKTHYGLARLDIDSTDYLSSSSTINFDDESISKAVVAFHTDGLGIKEGASKMNLSVFDFVVLLMDHIWKERDKTIENYSISRVASYFGVDRAQMRILSNLVNSSSAPNPSDIAARTLCEPVELIVMLTMLTAQMYGWPVAFDFDQKWKEIETASVPSDEEVVETINDFMTIAREVLKEFKESRLSPPREQSIHSSTDNLVKMTTDLAQYTKSLVDELHNLPDPKKIVPRTDILLPSWVQKVEMLSKEKDSPNKTKTDSQKDDQNNSAPINDDISVVNVTRSELSQRIYDIIEDPVNLGDIAVGTLCLGRPRNTLNFVHCQVLQKISTRNYNILFHNGNTEVVDISRIALKIDGRLRMWEGVRVCALYRPRLRNERHRKAFYSGIVGVGPHGFTQNEMLIFFDNGIDSFVQENTVHILAEQNYKTFNCKDVIDRRSNWNLMAQYRQKFVKHYLNSFPDWPLVPMKRKENTQRVNILRNGKPHSAFVLRTERQFALLRFPVRGLAGTDCVAIQCNRHHHVDEWIYRGSERLDAIRQNIDRLEKIERQERAGVSVSTTRSRRGVRLPHNLEYALPLPRRNNESAEFADMKVEQDLCPRGQALLADNEPEFSSQNFTRRQTARKGGSLPVQHENICRETTPLVERVLRTRKNITVHPVPEWNNLRQIPHMHCTIDCLQLLDKDPYDKSFFGYSPYMIPLLVGWSRELVTFTRKAKSADNIKAVSSTVVYKTPCGILIYRMKQVAKYLKNTCSRLTIDLFTFDRKVRPNIIYHSPANAKVLDDYTNGYEAIPIPAYNEIDSEMPPKIEYDPRRYPYDKETDVSTISVDFCSGCTCTDDCSDETRCECRLLTRTEILRLDKSLQPSIAQGYICRNLAIGDEWCLSGLYECNEKCNCSRRSCHNRVVQQQGKIPLELFKTEKMGWGVRTLVDVPVGVFICIYAGAILTDSQAEKQGQMNGDEYFADVNLVDNVEKEKRSAGIDIGDPNDGYYSDDGNHGNQLNQYFDNESLVIDGDTFDDDDDDYYDSGRESSFSSEESFSETGAVKARKRRGGQNSGDAGTDTGEESQEAIKEQSKNSQSLAADLDYAQSSLVMLESDVFTDEMKCENDDSSMCEIGTTGPPKGRFDMLKYVESMGLPSLYTIDAKRKGNIGRFFNHSCEPNIRTQLVYVDTHDFRLPWISFFTTKWIAAGSELFWDYGYAEGAVNGKQLDCYCGSRFCRKRLL